MATIYRQVGALTQLLDELQREGIGAFRTLDDIRAFQNDYNNSLDRIRAKYGEMLRQEVVELESRYTRTSSELDRRIAARKTLLKDELEELKRTLARNENRNILMRLFFFSRQKRLTKRKAILENSFENEVERPFRKRFLKLDSLRAEIEDRENNAEDWVERYSASEIEEQQRIFSVLRELTPLFYGVYRPGTSLTGVRGHG